MKLFRLWMGVAAILISMSGCKSLRTMTAGAVNWRTVETRALSEQLDFRQVDLSGRVKLDYPEGGFSNLSASYRITIVKDSVIMIRVIKLIEAARILITTDSVFVQDRINSRLIACDFGLAEDMLGIPVEFQSLQALLLGQYDPIPEDMEVIQKRGNPKVFAGSAAGLTFRYEIDASTAKPTTILASSEALNRFVSLAYSDFEQEGGVFYPSSGQIDVTGTDELSVTFTHRKISFTEDLRLASFDVPSEYTRENCQ